MNKDIKAKWVAALRSGKYRQGKRLLRTEDGFCCLGVLCDLYDSSLWEPGGFLDEDRALPVDVRKWSGLDSVLVEIDFVRESLAGHNDSGCTFAQIADAIEAQL